MTNAESNFKEVRPTVAAALSRRVNAPTERGDYSPSQPKKIPDGD
jgi:hypothetical protein